MCSDMVLRPMPDRAHHQIDSLQTPESALYLCELLVIAYHVIRGDLIRLLTGADHVNPIQRFFLTNLLLITGKRKSSLPDGDREMLPHLKTVDHLAHLLPNLFLA